MPQLTTQQQVFIVTRLACFQTPSEVAEAFQAAYGLPIPRQQVGNYNPETREGKKLRVELRSLFERTRARYEAEVQDVPIAHQAVRLRRLQELIDQNPGNPVLVARLLEKGARECGRAVPVGRRSKG